MLVHRHLHEEMGQVGGRSGRSGASARRLTTPLISTTIESLNAEKARKIAPRRAPSTRMKEKLSALQHLLNSSFVLSSNN